MTDPDLSQTETRGPVSFDVLAKFPTHADALREIERLRVAGERLYAICVLVRAPFGHRAMLRDAMQKWLETRRG